MTPVRLTCPNGHTWEYPGPLPVPDAVRADCPVCAVAGVGGPTQHAPAGFRSPTDPTDFSLRTDLGPGRVLGGFEIIAEVNRGGMGVIYTARQPGLDRVVALKVISPSRLGNPDALKRFQQEVKAAAKLSHPNIVQVYSTDLTGPHPFLAMEYVPGIDLAKLVKTAGPLDPADAGGYILQAAHGLQHAHEEGLVHRDIKPANLMVTPSPLDRPPSARAPRVKVLDMGLARVVADGDAAGPGDLTRDGIFLGTPDYVAPEQAEDSRRADIRADIYSLGATLFFLLTGDIPFPGSSVVQKLRKQLTEPPPSPAARRAGVGPGLDALVRRMMARSPVERIQTPAELVEALERVLRGGPAFVGTAGPAAAPPPPGPMHPPTPSDVHLKPPSGAYPALLPLTGPPSATHLPLPPAGAVVKAHDGGFHGLAVTPDGKQVLTGGLDGHIRVWNPVKMREVRAFAGDAGPVAGLALAPAGRWGVSCATRLTTAEMRVQMWDVARGVEHGRLKGAADNYKCVAVAADGKKVAAGSADRSVWVWTLEASGPKPVRLAGHTAAVTGVAFSRSGDTLLSAGEDGTLRQWDLKGGGVEKGSVNATVGPVLGLAFGGKRMAAAGKGLAVRQRDGAFVRLIGHDGPVRCVAFSADGAVLASGGADGTVRLWNPEDGAELACLTGHAQAVWAVAFGPDGGVVYSGGEAGDLRRWPVNLTLG